MGYSIINTTDFGVLLQMDNGDTQFLTHADFEIFKSKQKK